MKKLLAILLLCSSVAGAEKVRAIQNAQTGRPDYITVLSSLTLPSGSTQYIQNTNSPTTATQQFSVQTGSATTSITTPKLIFSARSSLLQAENGNPYMGFQGTFNSYGGENSNSSSAGSGFNACWGYTCMNPYNNGLFSWCGGAFCMSGTGYAGEQNGCNGYACMFSMTSGSFNYCNGGSCMGNTTTAVNSVCNGTVCLRDNRGDSNTCDGGSCLEFNTTGTRNISFGSYSGTHFIVANSTDQTTQNDMQYYGYGATPGRTDINGGIVIGNNGIVSSSYTLAMRIDNLAIVQSTAPTLTSCGTSPSIVGSDSAFTVTVGGTTTGCTVGFNQTFVIAPSCVVSERTQSLVNALSYTVSVTGMTFSQTALNGNVLDVHCIGSK